MDITAVLIVSAYFWMTGCQKGNFGLLGLSVILAIIAILAVAGRYPPGAPGIDAAFPGPSIQGTRF